MKWIRVCCAFLIIGAIIAIGLALRSANPRVSKEFVETASLRVITYNVQFLPGIAKHFNKRPDAEYRARRIGHALAEMDVIGLNEMFDAAPRGILLDELRKQRGSDFYCVMQPEKDRSAFGIDSGLIIVSRFPVIDWHSMTYGNDSSIQKYGLFADGFAAKGALHAQISLRDWTGNDDTFDVFVTHLESKDRAIREEQYVKLAAFVRAHSDPGRPVLIMGDFNTAGNPDQRGDPKSAYHRLMNALQPRRPFFPMIDLWPEHSGEVGGTTDQERPDGGRRIDFIFLSNSERPAMLAREVAVNRFLDDRVGALSDHSAVEALIQWKRLN